MKRIIALLGTAFLLCLAMAAMGGVPQLINYQGLLKTSGGNPVPDGPYSVTFTVYDAATAGTNLWTETQSVTTAGGLFTVLLGSGPTPITDVIFNDTTRYLGIKVGADPEMTPRSRLGTMPYSYRTSTVDGASGGVITGRVGIGGDPGSLIKLYVEDTFNGIAVKGWSPSGYGVFGQSTNGFGVYGSTSSGTGVYGNSTGFAAVYGNIGGNFGTYGGYFQGDVFVERNVVVVGTLFKGGLAFKIDHPLDPSHKYLNHSGVESPDMKNIYDGIVTTDAEGSATVTLPDWFGALNREFRYQLTVIGYFAQAIISKKIEGNHFSILTDKPNIEVSWQVTGIRQDAYANAHRIPLEEKKIGKEWGKYLHPKEHGASETLGIQYETIQKLEVDRKKQEEQLNKIKPEPR